MYLVSVYPTNRTNLTKGLAWTPINSCTATITFSTSCLVMYPSLFKSYKVKVHRNFSCTLPRSNVESDTSMSWKKEKKSGYIFYYLKMSNIKNLDLLKFLPKLPRSKVESMSWKEEEEKNPTSIKICFLKDNRDSKVAVKLIFFK